MFQALYDSPWHSPGLYWLLGGLFLLAVLWRRPFLLALSILFSVVVLCDVLVTGALAPLGASPWAGRLAIVFVILGDLRYFLLVERYIRRPDGGPGVPGMALLAAAGLSLLVPLASGLPQAIMPALYPSPRHLFLTYELMFALLALALRVGVLPRRLRRADPDLRRWLLGLTTFELVQYAGWAAADALILAGVEAGFLLRLAPNALYYGGFLPFAYYTAPRRLRGLS
jgi:hypothetical protein